MHLFLTGRNENNLHHVKTKCETKGAKVTVLVGDVTDKERMEEVSVWSFVTGLHYTLLYNKSHRVTEWDKTKKIEQTMNDPTKNHLTQ